MAINFFYNISRIVRWIFKQYGSLNKNTLIFQTNTVWGSFCSLVSLFRTILLTMLLIASITFYYHYNILGFIWSTGYTYSSCFYHHQIGSINLITFSVVVCLRCLLHHILSLIAYTFQENLHFVFTIIAQFMMSANNRMRFGLQIVFVCLYITPSHHHHHPWANFSEDNWTYKMPVTYILSSVWVRLNTFYQFSIIQCMGLCVFSLPISLVMIGRIYILCIIITIKS